MISSLLLTLGFFISSFSSCFRCRVRLFIWFFSCFLRLAYIAMNLTLITFFYWIPRFWVVVFSFSFVSMHILISFLISSVICWLFSSMLFSLHMLAFLIVFFSCNWDLILQHCVRKDAWNDFNFFEFTKARFVAQDVIYPGEGSMCAWEKGEIHCFGVKCPIDIN